MRQDPWLASIHSTSRSSASSTVATSPAAKFSRTVRFSAHDGRFSPSRAGRAVDALLKRVVGQLRRQPPPLSGPPTTVTAEAVVATAPSVGEAVADPLYQIRNLLWAGAERLTDCQRARLHAVFAVDRRVEGRVPPTSVSKSATDTPWCTGCEYLSCLVRFLRRRGLSFHCGFCRVARWCRCTCAQQTLPRSARWWEVVSPAWSFWRWILWAGDLKGLE